MQVKNGNIRQGNTDTRRTELIEATLNIIANEGLAAATVRRISKDANVTSGLIRYYFETKDDLIAAAYELHMSRFVEAADQASRGKTSAKKRLTKFIQVSLEAPVTSHASVAVWAGFFAILLHDDVMTASHKRSYDLLRLHLKELIANVLIETNSQVSDQQLRRLSIAGNAILDGLWMEGGALPKSFKKGELVQVGLESFGALLNTSFK